MHREHLCQPDCFGVQVTCVSAHSSGQWLASASRDGTVRVWEVATARCVHKWRVEPPALSVAWCPAPGLRIVAVATQDAALLLPIREPPPRGSCCPDESERRILLECYH